MFIIDRFEADFAVLAALNGEMRQLPREKLPPDAKEGDCLTETAGIYALDRAATARRKKRIEGKLERLLREGHNR